MSVARRGAWPAGAVAGAVAVMGCQDPYLPTIAISGATNCARVEATTLARPLVDAAYPWDEVRDAATDHGDGDVDATGIWLLTTTGGSPRRWALSHLRGTVHEFSIPLPYRGEVGSRLRLHAGPEPGDAWLVYDDPQQPLEVWRVAASGGPAIHATLTGFPNPPPDATNICPSTTGTFARCDNDDWSRELAFARDQAFVIAMPRNGTPDLSSHVYIGNLGPELDVDTQYLFDFTRECSETPSEDLPLCDDLDGLRYLDLSLTAVQRDPGRSTFGFAMIRQLGDLERVDSELVDVTVSVDTDGRVDTTIHVQSDLDISPDPDFAGSGYAVDRLGAFLRFGNASSSRLYRVIDSVARGNRPLFDEIVVPQSVAPTEAVLLQLDRDIALGTVDDIGWSVTKLFPESPSASQTIVLEGDIDGGPAGVREAAPGVFLVRFEDDPTLVQLRCASE